MTADTTDTAETTKSTQATEAREAAPSPGRQAFLVICKDRHVDLGLSIHLTRAGADAAVAAFQAHYGDDHAWVEESWGAPKWVRYVRSAEGDGPSAYVEISQIAE